MKKKCNNSKIEQKKLKIWKDYKTMTIQKLKTKMKMKEKKKKKIQIIRRIFQKKEKNKKEKKT